MPYTYSRETDGTDETYDIRTPDGDLLTSVHFWDDAEYAEAKAKLIVNALNAYQAEDITMTREELRKRHYERLNDYRNSVEYQACPNCYRPATDELKTLIGDRWEIDEEIYDDALNCLPPLGWRGGVFYMREFTFDDITAKFTKEGDRYYCEFARFPRRMAA